MKYYLFKAKDMWFKETLFEYKNNRKETRKEKFLKTMELIIPWDLFIEEINKYWFNQKRGRKKTETLLMLKIHLLQKYYHLADEAVEDEIWNQIAFQRFLDIDVGTSWVPDATTIENFRHTLEENEVSEKIFEKINLLLLSQWLYVQNGSSVDATIMEAPSSTKNKEKKRDEDMKQTRKWNQWYFWMKVHVWTDTRSWIAHTLHTSGANIHDSEYFDKCLHGKEKVVFADKAYQSKERVKELRKKWITSKIYFKAQRWRKLSKKQKYENRKRSSIRSKCEHIFHQVKNIFWWKKVPYKWLKKNTQHFFMVFWLANLCKVQKQLLSS